ncbi:UNVERIFIED_CONTAM: putative proteasome inhibitor [Sesamum angustifolium]|uniref:Proteasome inhibitor n=1 Tax=Sesamum angustifolium TaxID=2727405 RepID=A0AAW2N5F2_9LAMI
MATEQSIMAVIRAARPSFRSRFDKVAFAVHASFVAAGYVLHATGPPAFTDDALSSSSSSDEVGLENWNDLEENYAFVYSNPEKGSKKVLVKCLVMNDKLLVDALKEGDSSPLHLEVDVGQYVEDNGGTNYGSQFKNLGKLVANVNKEILDKLDGSLAATSSSQPSSSETRDDRTRPRLRVDDTEDPYVSPPPTGFIVPPVPGFGGSDIFPGPGAGMYPSRGDIGGGSMLVGPDDPRFFGGRIGEPGFHGGLPGVPPGARFDPYGPPGVPGFEPGRFASLGLWVQGIAENGGQMSTWRSIFHIKKLEAARLLTLGHFLYCLRQSYKKAFATLGVVCKCCDADSGTGDDQYIYGKKLNGLLLFRFWSIFCCPFALYKPDKGQPTQHTVDHRSEAFEMGLS